MGSGDERVAGSYKSPQGRVLRAQGRRTLRRLLDAGLEAFAARGYHVVRVDDIVREAQTSHGTFYLYFANKEDLLRSLAIECAERYEELAVQDPPIEQFVADFFAIYERYGPVIRAWMENAVTDREVNRLGVEAFTHIATALSERLGRVGAPHDPATVGSLMALLERSAYYAVVAGTATRDASSVATIVQRGYFAVGG
jgi:AcrR family transcriptional regulator